jgi:hydroxymethylpyrimidine kinase/phosphomethylpyrimidine kinase/thiamine-phosphate diphosphorylase
MRVLNRAIVWTIAGSDCTGGAGVQADIKTMHSLGAEACCVVTAVTAQNSSGVIAINPMPDEVILSQIEALESSKKAEVIKLGLLANRQQVELIAERLTDFKTNWRHSPTIIYDPVTVASSGDHLTEENTLSVIKQKLLPLVDIITPNAVELADLTKTSISSWRCIQLAAQKLQKLGVGSVIVKGGHIPLVGHQSIDFCTDGVCEYWLSSNRIDTEHSHGSGCTFSSAVASLLAQNYLLRDAFVIAKAYINQGLKAAKKHTGSYGSIWQGFWPDNVEDYPEVLVYGSEIANQIGLLQENHCSVFCSGFPSVETERLGLYPIVDSIEWLERLLKTRIKTIQYREKKLSQDKLEAAIKQAIQLGNRFKVRLFINDHWQLAVKYQAYGVHLGQQDLHRADLQKIKQAGLRLGISTHGHYEMLKATQYQPSYIAIGAIFPTKTKDMTGQIQGLKTLKNLVKLNSKIPLVAIGGINLKNASSVLDTNVGCIAVVSAITASSDPEHAIEKFQKLLNERGI